MNNLVPAIFNSQSYSSMPPRFNSLALNSGQDGEIGNQYDSNQTLFRRGANAEDQVIIERRDSDNSDVELGEPNQNPQTAPNV